MAGGRGGVYQSWCDNLLWVGSVFWMQLLVLDYLTTEAAAYLTVLAVSGVVTTYSLVNQLRWVSKVSSRSQEARKVPPIGLRHTHTFASARIDSGHLRIVRLCLFQKGQFARWNVGLES